MLIAAENSHQPRATRKIEWDTLIGKRTKLYVKKHCLYVGYIHSAVSNFYSTKTEKTYVAQKLMTKTKKQLKPLMRKMHGFSFLSLGGCFDSCRDHTQGSGHGTRIWNLSDRPVELQIRVGSILKKIHTLKAGSSKRVKCKSIYKAYMPVRSGSVGGSLLYYYDETCHPYIWIQDTGCDSLRMVKQQYISLEDLRDSSEIRIFRDHQRGCISVRKRTRPDFCWFWFWLMFVWKWHFCFLVFCFFCLFHYGFSFFLFLYCVLLVAEWNGPWSCIYLRMIFFLNPLHMDFVIT